MQAPTPTWKTPLLWLLAAGACLPMVTPPLALFAGLVFAILVGNTDAKRAAKVQKYLLQASVVGLGFGIQFEAVLRAGSTGVVLTAATIAATLLAGVWLAHVLGVERVTGRLIAAGTAICGGSAIAAVGPVLGAEARVMSVSLGCVFVLNAVALFIFPAIGHWVELTPEQFGYWAAIAIHDTSSVVGAAARYSAESLAVAVPVKLARALWILPLVAVLAWQEKCRGATAVVPWFVVFFLVASAVTTFVPAGEEIYPWLARAAKAGLAATLFLIGASLSKDNLRNMGWRPFGLSLVLWLAVSAVSLGVIGALR